MSGIDFDGRIAIVTGGGNGLGREYCLELGRRGAKVVVNDLGGTGAGQGASHAAADLVVDEIKAAGGDAVANYDSVASREGGQAIVETAVRAFGGVDILINNAGFLRNNRFEDLTDEQIDSVLAVHLKGAFYVSQPAYRVMKERGYGRLLFTASASGLFGHPWQANYAAAKAGNVGLSNVIALEGLRHNIFSNALLPTAQTRLAQEMQQDWMEVGNVAQYLGQIDFAAIGSRMGSEQNVALALYLVSEQSKATHGIYSCLAGRYARVFVGATDGWVKQGDAPAAIEDIASNWSQIEDRSVYQTPESVYEEFIPVVEKIKAGR